MSLRLDLSPRRSARLSALVIAGVLAGAAPSRRRTRMFALVIAGVLAGAAPAAASAVPSYELSHFAGNGSGGALVPGPATSSPLNNPFRVSVDSSGDVYIGDYHNYEVEKVNPAGDISDVAGTPGQSGVEAPGTATSTEMSAPIALAAGPDGSFYFGDYSDNEIFKVTSNGDLTVFAGNGGSGPATPGLATSTSIGQSYGLAVDSAGDVYIGDYSDGYVYEVTPTGTLSIVAGNGGTGAPTPGPATQSDLDAPSSLAVDSAGNLYIADAGHDDIEKVTPSGTLSIIAGTGTSGTPTDGPATSSDLSFPQGVALDAAGDVYIASSNNYIAEVTPDGQLTVIAGNGSYGAPSYGVAATSSALDTVQSVASTPAGRLYINEFDHNTVDELAPPAPASTTPPALPGFSGTPTIGQTLTANTGSWTNDPVIYAYQWDHCNSSGGNCTAISGATSSTYTVSSADAGYALSVVVTAQNGGGSVTADSPATGAVPVPATPTAPAPVTTSTTAPVTSTPVAQTPAPSVTPAPAACPWAQGAIDGTTLGSVELGEPMSAIEAAFPNHSGQDYGFERFCLSGGAFRVESPPQALTANGGNASLRGRVVLALTANGRYALDGIRPGEKLSVARSYKGVADAIVSGKNTWYVIPGTKANGVLKVSGGVVREIGIASLKVTATKHQQLALFRQAIASND